MVEYVVSQPLIEIGDKRPIYFIAVRLVNVPGALSRVAGVLARYGVNILSGVHYAPPEAKEGVWVFAADFTKASRPVEDVVKELEKVDGIKAVEWGVKRFGRILLPPFTVKYSVLGKGAVLERREWLGEVNKVIVKELGPGAEALMFHVGFRAGYSTVDYWKEISGLKGEALLRLYLEVVKALNWISEYEILVCDLTRPRVMFRVWDLRDCSVLKGRVDRPTSNYFRGVFSGVLSRLTGKMVILREVRCVAMGDPYCEFVFM